MLEFDNILIKNLAILIIMICEILLTKPIEKTFYYKTSKFLETGIVVKVEFKSKKVVGVVIKTHKEKIYNKPLKSIDNILSSTPLPNEILKSTEFVAKYTCNFRALILKLFLTGFERNSTIKLEKIYVIGLKNSNYQANKDRPLNL